MTVTLLPNKFARPKLMIFVQNRQTLTKRNQCYAAKGFDLFWTKRTVLEPWNYLATRLVTTHRNQANQAKPASFGCSWHSARFFPAGLLQRTSSTLPSTPRKENTLSTQVRSYWTYLALNILTPKSTALNYLEWLLYYKNGVYNVKD